MCFFLCLLLEATHLNAQNTIKTQTQMNTSTCRRDNFLACETTNVDLCCIDAQLDKLCNAAPKTNMQRHVSCNVMNNYINTMSSIACGGRRLLSPLASKANKTQTIIRIIIIIIIIIVIGTKKFSSFRTGGFVVDRQCANAQPIDHRIGRH